VRIAAGADSTSCCQGLAVKSMRVYLPYRRPSEACDAPDSGEKRQPYGLHPELADDTRGDASSLFGVWAESERPQIGKRHQL
jgi:hypothetical protein